MAASLSIGGGSYNDPWDNPGLAHLGEHMVTTTKPLVSLQHSVLAAGGVFSASTGTDQTTFGFEISSHHRDSAHKYLFLFQSTLPLFLSLFKLPKLDLKALTREIAVVDEEHILNTTSAERVVWHGLRLLCSKLHPMRKFSTGNTDTLGSISVTHLKTHLQRYLEQHYVPCNLTLTIKGPQSILHLKKLFKQLISEVLTDQVVQSSTRNVSLFNERDPNIVVIASGLVCKTQLLFSLEPLIPANVIELVVSIIGDESKDSFCHILKIQEQLAESICVYSTSVSAKEKILFVDIEVTRLGLRRLTTIIEWFFAYIEAILAMSSKDLNTLVHEHNEIKEFCFKSAPLPHSSLDECITLSERLQQNVSEELLVRGEWASTNYVSISEQIKAFLTNQISRSSMRVLIVNENLQPAKIFSSQTITPLQDPYYGFEYVLLHTDFARRHSLLSTHKPVISFPIGNLRNFVPSLLTCVDVESNSRTVKTGIPQLWSHTDCGVVYVDQNCGRNLIISLHLDFGFLPQKPAMLVNIEIILAVLGARVKTKLYNLEFFGCEWGIYANVNNKPCLLVTVSGREELAIFALNLIHDEFSSLLESITECLYQETKRARTLLRRKYESYENAKGVKYAFIVSHSLLEEEIVSADIRIRELELADKNSLTEIGKYLASPLSKVSMLFSGDILETSISEVVSSWQETFSGVNGRLNWHGTSLQIPLGLNFVMELESPESDPIAVAFYYIQLGERGLPSMIVLAKLLELVISASAFHNLRTKRNLGYGVLTGLHFLRTQFGVHITVPSSQHTCEYLADQIEEYLEDVGAEIDAMSESDFAALKETLRELRDQELSEESTSNLFANIKPILGSEIQARDADYKCHWDSMNQILNGTFHFGGRNCEETIDWELLKDTDVAAFRRFFREKVAVASAGRSTVIISKPATGLSPEKKRAVLCQMLHRKLAEEKLIIPQSELMTALESCTDLDSLKDLDLSPHFSKAGHAWRYRKFKMKLSLGVALSRLLAPKHAASKYPGKKIVLTQMYDFQRLCLQPYAPDAHTLQRPR